MKRIDRFGIHTDNCLGYIFVQENNMYRIIFKNRMSMISDLPVISMPIS